MISETDLIATKSSLTVYKLKTPRTNTTVNFFTPSRSGKFRHLPHTICVSKQKTRSDVTASHLHYVLRLLSLASLLQEFPRFRTDVNLFSSFYLVVGKLHQQVNNRYFQLRLTWKLWTLLCSSTLCVDERQAGGKIKAFVLV